MPFDPKAFADELATRLAAILESRKDEIIADAGGWPRRAAIRLAWPTLIGEIPPMTETLVELVAEKFGHLTVDDLLDALQQIKQRSHLGGIGQINGSAGEGQVPQSRA
ncbi:MAG TPA: hypothetical protein VGH33_04335 [Isosphaeraceae bacterium]|jgi:hypothetical protein